MGKISLIIPEATTNFISNPSIEVDTTGWVLLSSAITRVTTEQKFGVASLEINTSNLIAEEGARHDAVIAAGAGISFIGSLWAKRDGGGTIRLLLWDVDTGNGTYSNPVTLSSEWQRLTVTHTLTGASTSMRLFCRTNVQQNITFYIDAVQVEEQSEITTYCDGDQAGCEWLGADHASTSSRSAQSRYGGTIVDLDDYNVTVDQLLGFEMPPLRHNVHDLSLQPGAFLQGIKVQPRVLQLVGRTNTGTESAQYTALQNLINAFKEDRVATLQPVILRYTAATTTIEILCFYDTGLEGAFRCTGHSRFTMRLICYDPFWKEIGESAEVLDTLDTLSVFGIQARLNGQWTDIDYAGALKSTETMEIGLDRLVYWGGNFTDLGGIAEADYLAKFDPITLTWTAVADGGTGRVRTIAIGPDGMVYFGGDFLNWDGVGADYIAKWDGTVYTDIEAGETGDVYDIAVDPTDGSLAVGGDFLNWNGVPTSDYIVKYDRPTEAWVDITAAGACQQIVYAVAYAPNGTLYIGGWFTTIGGLGVMGAPGIAAWDGANWSALDAGFDTRSVYALAVALDGTLYVGGDFTIVGGGPGNYIAKWDGVAWSQLGEGLENTVDSLAIADNGDVFVGGSFDSDFNGNQPLANMARWNGASWSAIDAEPIGPPVTHIAIGYYDPVIPNNFDIFIEAAGQGFVDVAGLTTVTNDGTATAYPRITIHRSGGVAARLLSIRNETTGLELLFNLPLLDGETITIDLQPGNKTIQSNWRGNVIGALLPNSDFASFALLPGDNEISAYVTETGGGYEALVVTAHIIWRDPYWSVSGAE